MTTESAEGRYTHRERVLDGAKQAVMMQRNASYGPPSADFERSAQMMTALLGEKLKPGAVISASEVAKLQICVKLSRTVHTPQHEDSFLDIAGYAACGLEAAHLAPDTSTHMEEQS